MGRPFEKLPPGAKRHLEAMASNGLLSESRAADALGMPLEQLRRVLKEHKPSAEIWDNALSIERDALLEALYSKATKDGDVKAAQTLLAARHGVSDKVPQNNGDRVNITFQLPAAMDPGDYLKAIQPKVEALPDGD